MRGWWDQADCRGKADEFFPSERETKRIRAAKAICQGCPVRVECLYDAIKYDDQGIRGGLTYDERLSVRSLTIFSSLADDRGIQLPHLESEPELQDTSSRDIPKSEPHPQNVTSLPVQVVASAQVWHIP